MTEFDLYCRTKSDEVRRALSPVRDMILSALSECGAPDVLESRVHFYLVYHMGSTTVVKLHPDAKGRPVLSFVNGADLKDEQGLLKGRSLVRTIPVRSDAWLEQKREAIVALLRQSHDIMKGRWDSATQMAVLGPDQPSP